MRRPVRRLVARRCAWLLVSAAVAWNLVSLRAETLPVAYLDDSSVHEQMVRFATELLRSGELPLTSWFPFLGEGSPQFLHYQSLPAIIAGAAGLVVGPDVAFRWSLYLLLSLWPLSVYLGGRLLGLGRLGAGCAAAMAPFLVSATGIGYEQRAYVWAGFGVWTQLWGSMTLPLAWGLSWRAIRRGRGYSAAVAAVAVTTALHYETGYLALLPLLLLPLVAGRPVLARVRRAAVLGVGSLLAVAWVIVPLVAQRDWAARNEPLQGTGLVNGYGAGKMLGWLLSGQLLDHGRLPVITALAAVGLALASARCHRSPDCRAMLALLALCLVLSFGRATFGSLVDLLPGSADIFFRRFEMGVQLVCLLLAGGGAAWCARTLWRAADRWAVRRGFGSPATAPSALALAPVGALVAMAAVLAPAWLQLGAYDRHTAEEIAAQRRADATQGRQLDRLIAVIKRDGGGRAYAGMPSNWGADFTVGQVPVFKYLESEDVDEVGYTLRTASLMTDPEYHFDEDDLADYRLFAIRYVLVPSSHQPPIPAHPLIRAGPYSLWTTAINGYLQTARIIGTYPANRGDLGARSVALLRSGLASRGDYLRIAYDHAGRPGRLPPVAGGGPAGTIVHERDDLQRGTVTATIHLDRPGIIVLSFSYDPGWRASVDGRRQPIEMVAPALPATRVPAGTHTVSFNYTGYRDYPQLLALAALTLLTIAAGERRARWQHFDAASPV
ncbi:MAG TPA: YfhO family protein [Solirubrobacteraceae bacterium]|nr:YfhO family protein [Solirubrobacteraceae bacterium]